MRAANKAHIIAHVIRGGIDRSPGSSGGESAVDGELEVFIGGVRVAVAEHFGPEIGGREIRSEAADETRPIHSHTK